MEIILWTGIILVVIVVGAFALAAAVRGMRPKEPEAMTYTPTQTTASVATTHTAPAHSAVPASVASVRSSLPATVADEIDRLVANDQKIQAIKALREHTGFGLKESKDLIESWPSSRRP